MAVSEQPESPKEKMNETAEMNQEEKDLQHAAESALDEITAENAEVSGCGVEVAELLELDGLEPEEAAPRQRKLLKHVETCAQCQHTLESVAVLDNLSNDFFNADASQVTKNWIDSLVQNIPIEARAGRLVPLEISAPNVQGYQTEGSLRSLVRRSARSSDLIVTRVRFDGEVEEPNAKVSVNIRVAIRYGAIIRDVVDEARAKVLIALANHTDLQVNQVNIEVVDILAGVAAKEESVDL